MVLPTILILIDDEKVCLIDTVEVDFFTQFIERLREVLGDRQIDYLVINTWSLTTLVQ